MHGAARDSIPRLKYRAPYLPHSSTLISALAVPGAAGAKAILGEIQRREELWNEHERPAH
jgi:hypothetical protein